MHISSSYAKILGEKLFHTWEIPRSGSKAKDGERKKERAKVGENNGQATHGACKHAWRMQARMAHASRLGQKLSLELSSTNAMFLHVMKCCM